jgi:hypothetical protein
MLFVVHFVLVLIFVVVMFVVSDNNNNKIYDIEVFAEILSNRYHLDRHIKQNLTFVEQIVIRQMKYVDEV